MRIIEPSIELLTITSNPEQLIEAVGRTCYKSERKRTKDSAPNFVRGLRKSGHHAMLEFGTAAFKIITDRGITHEIVRHRIASYAQESTRYCNYSSAQYDDHCSFIQPPGLCVEDGPEGINTEVEWIDACDYAEKAYFRLLKAGKSPQIARSVLPNSLKTEINMMANLREYRHFVKLRAAKDAHPQIRLIAVAMWEILMAAAPSVFEDLWSETWPERCKIKPSEALEPFAAKITIL